MVVLPVPTVQHMHKLEVRELFLQNFGCHLVSRSLLESGYARLVATTEVATANVSVACG